MGAHPFTYGELVQDVRVEDYLRSRQRIPPYLWLDTTEDHHQPDSFTPDRVSALRQTLESHGTKLVIHHPFQVNLAHAVTAARNAATAYCLELLVLAKNLDAEFVIIHGGYVPGITKKGYAKLREQALQNLFASLRTVINRADELGVSIALENFPVIPNETTGQDIIWLLTSADEMDLALKTFPSNRVGFLFEVGHANTAGALVDYVRRFSPRILGAHISDNHGTHDDHLPIGEGNIDWTTLLRQLRDGGFKGPFLMDMDPSRKDVHSYADDFQRFWPA